MMAARKRCRNGAAHWQGPEPSGYRNWHEWAERMATTHVQQRCPGCGLWVIWTPKGETPAPVGTVESVVRHRAICTRCGESCDGDGAEWAATPERALGVVREYGWEVVGEALICPDCREDRTR